jgi:glycerol 2-dehydrogenase (NADP+)
MHWPISLPPNTGAEYGKEDRTAHDPSWTFVDTWREMSKLISTGKVRAIGVANFSTVNLEKLLSSLGTDGVVPAVNQTEIQPLLPQDKLHRYCKEKGILQTAFGPLGGSQSGGSLHEDETIKGIADAHGCGTANVMLSWAVQRGWSVVPKSTNPERIAKNLKGNVVLSGKEIEAVDALARPPNKGKRFNVPNWGTTVFHDDEGLDLA